MEKSENEKEVVTKLDRLVRKQEHLDKQLEHILRLIQGDEMINKIRPTGLIHDVKNISFRLENMHQETRDIMNWWSERGKRKYIIDINLVTWGKVILWIIAVAGAVGGFFAWLKKYGIL